MQYLFSLLVVLSAWSLPLQASEHLCHTSKNQITYCKYQGEITQVYINNQNTLMAYFEKPIDKEKAKILNGELSYTKAAAIQIDENNKIFADYAFQLMLAAQINEMPVVMHIHKIENGLLMIDRLWLQED